MIPLTPTQQQASKAIQAQMATAVDTATKANLPIHDIATILAHQGLTWWVAKRATEPQPAK